MVDALALKGDEGRSMTAISSGEVSSNFRSGDLRMGKPTAFCAVLFGLTRESIPREVKHLST